MRARLNGIFALVLAAAVAASAAYAADTIGLARKLVGYTGGVSLILRNFEGGVYRYPDPQGRLGAERTVAPGDRADAKGAA